MSPLLVAIGLLQGQLQVVYLDPSKNISLQNNSILTMRPIDQTADAEGNPLTLISKTDGLTAVCHRLHVEIVTSSDDVRSIRLAQLFGDVNLKVESNALLATNKDRESQPLNVAGPKPEISQTETFRSENLNYSVKDGEARVESPKNFQLDIHQRGPGQVEVSDSKQKKKVDSVLDDTMVITGSSSTVTLDAKKSEDRPILLRKGAISGPVHLHHMRKEFVQGKEVGATDLDILADSITFDFTKPNGEVIAMGHITFIGKGNNAIGNGTAQRMTITFDKNFQIVSLEMT